MLHMRRTTRDILSDEHGVSIVFAVILVVALLVIGGILVTTGYANFSRATSDVPAEQNEKTVTSAATFVQGKLDGATVTAIGGNPSQGFKSVDMPWIKHLLKQDGGTVTLSVEGSGLPADALQDVAVKAVQKDTFNFRIYVYTPDDSGTANGTAMKFDVTVDGYQSGTGTLSTTTPTRAGDGA